MANGSQESDRGEKFMETTESPEGANKTELRIPTKMSNIEDVMNRLNQITACSICAKTFQDPRVLPCTHTYCLRCLQSIGLSLSAGEKMPCPLCREVFLIPENGLAGLRKNFFMANLIEMSLISNPIDRDKLCDNCSEDETVEVSQATMYCVECRQKLCDHCCKEHKRRRLGHQMLQLGIPPNRDVAKQFGPNLCEFHPGRPADLYCADCKGILCMTCFAESHQSHQCTDVSNVAENFRRLLGKNIDEVTGCLGQMLGMKRMLQKEKERFVKEVEDVKAGVVRRSEELKETLERHTKSLLEELASVQALALEEFGKDMEEMEGHLKTLETFKNYCIEMKSKGSPSDVCRSMVDLRKRTGELTDLHSVQTKKPICCLDISFRITENQDYVHSHPNVIGVITGTASRLRYKALVTSNRPVTTSRLIKRLVIADRNVTGVACLDGRLYVLLANAIRVYKDLEPFSLVTELTIPGMKSLVDIAACPNSMCLYITDRDRSCIWRLSANNEASVIIPDIVNPYTLSVSGEGNLVTLRWGQPSRVEIYRSDAVLMHLVTLEPEITLPYHAVQTSAGNIVLSHGGKNNRTHRVLELSLEGRILRSFPMDNQLHWSLNCPTHLALDAEDRVFVADFYNGIVILLRPQLELDQLLVVEERDGVRRPSRLCYLADRKMLFLVNGNKGVDVYTLNGSEMEAWRGDPVEVAKKQIAVPRGIDDAKGVGSSRQEVPHLKSGRFT